MRVLAGVFRTTWPISNLMSNQWDVKNSSGMNRFCCLALAFPAGFASQYLAHIIRRSGSSATPWWVFLFCFGSDPFSLLLSLMRGCSASVGRLQRRKIDVSFQGSCLMLPDNVTGRIAVSNVQFAWNCWECCFVQVELDLCTEHIASGKYLIQ